jgi:radical SAM C-methyltransferase
MRKTKVWLVQSSVSREPWLPLASGYLKAAAMSDAAIANELDIRIFNYGCDASATRMFDELYTRELPDIVAFSVMGWDYLRFQRVGEVFRMMNPSGWIIYGGNHVANQAERVFSECPHVDVIVNGEGEFSFVEILRSYLTGKSVHELHHVEGISFRAEPSRLVILGSAQTGIVTTPTKRISELDRIPSPLLTGALEIMDAHGRPIFSDRMLLETNRGCPFSCSFCYWGGAIGQKVRGFSAERMREELDYLGRSQTFAISLCDANFGMIPQDEQFVEDLLKTKEKYGYPQALYTPWGKNKSDLFYRVVTALKNGGMFSNFIVSLQSTSKPALESMRRHNMKINEWEPLVDWCAAQGLHVSSELIWGVPGETAESFLAGFDEIAKKVDRISCYDLKLMPNTEYWDQRKELGIVAKRSETEDYYTVLFHKTISLEDNRRMHRFLFWQKVLHDFCTFRFLWRPLATLGGISTSEALFSIDEWFDGLEPVGGVRQLVQARDRTVNELDVAFVKDGIRALYQNWAELSPHFDAWFREAILGRVPSSASEILAEVFRFDQASMPAYDGPPAPDLEALMISAVPVYLRRDLTFKYDVPALIVRLAEHELADLEPKPTTKSFLFPSGFANAIETGYGAALGGAYAGTPLDPDQMRGLGLMI